VIPTPSHLVFAQSSDVGISQLLRSSLDQLSSPSGVAAVLLGIVFISITLLHRKGWMLLFLSIGFLAMLVEGTTTYFDNRLFSPLQEIREASRLLGVMLLTLLAVVVRREQRDYRISLLSILVILFLFFEVQYAFRWLLAGEIVRSTLSIITGVLFVVALPLGVGRTLKSDSDGHSLVRLIALLAVPYITCNLIQFVINPSATVGVGRFAGISGNAQQTGIMLSILILSLSWLIAIGRGTKARLPILIILLGFCGLLLLWTGSRTAALGTIVGMAIMFRKRWLVIVVVPTLGAIFALVAAALVGGELQEAMARMQSMENTRSGVWSIAVQEIMNSPIFGAIGIGEVKRAHFVESTPLQVLQGMGVVGFLPLLLVYLAIAHSCVGLFRMGGKKGLRSRLADYSLAIWGVLVVVSLFEAIFLGVITFFVFMIFLNMTLTAYLLSVGPGDDEEEWDRDEEEWDADAEEHEEDLENYTNAY
jgi:hypothetical protein